MKIYKTILFAFSLIFLWSCSDTSDYTVGYLNPAQNRERFVKEGNFMAEKLREYGIETLIKHAEDNDITQLEQGYELLAEGVDLLVIAAVNGNTIAPLVRDARSQGVKVIAYNRLINNSDYDMFVTGDNEEIARIFCEGALKAVPSGNYVVFAGDRFDKNGFEVKEHIDTMLKPHVEAGEINVIYETYIEGWNRERAAFEFQEVLDSHGLVVDAVISCNDPMGLGTVDVLNQYGIAGNVFVTGQDAILEAVRSIEDGEMNLTVYHPHRELGYKTGDLIAKILRENEDPEELANAETFNGTESIPTFRVKSMGINRENLGTLVDLGEYSWEEIRN
ncbi:D-xylose transport system substrate-binding protein [Marinilabilia salmonicolor]|jgi:D-xylose transport system substrate-binding protein|uniref:sugar ABC transporter substrate-binding protein n=1 Tax=Marinilabilia salmonicolor TaxID=989 RepID=UPI000D0578C1|nr:substrate-binding domain-containing protein [Marinilabilia salmonicolor]PRZ00381.1 D-xylose transport system substrate-binding protein [Marinilabilia salmonicolor]